MNLESRKIGCVNYARFHKSNQLQHPTIFEIPSFGVVNWKYNHTYLKYNQLHIQKSFTLQQHVQCRKHFCIVSFIQRVLQEVYTVFVILFRRLFWHCIFNPESPVRGSQCIFNIILRGSLHCVFNSVSPVGDLQCLLQCVESDWLAIFNVV